MFPEKSEYLFFMLKPDGGHKFCATYEDHLENIRKFRAYQKQKREEKLKREKALADANKTAIENNNTDDNKSKLSSDKNVTVSRWHRLKLSEEKAFDPAP